MDKKRVDMGYNELEIELRKTLAQIVRWREMGCMPMIEQGIALGRLQRIYAGLLDMPCGEPEGQAVEGADGAASGDLRADEGAGPAQETHVRQDDEAHDLCPSPTEFPEAEFRPEPEAQEENAVEEGSRVSVETHMQQEYWSRDLCPSPTEFPEAVAGEPAAADAPDADRGGDDADCETTGEAGMPDRDLVSDGTPEVKENADKGSEGPRIFGLEVSPYARHEMIDTLFHGNAELFEAECAKLDAMGSLEEALVYIGETYRWVPENAATIKFIDLLESRFEK